MSFQESVVSSITLQTTAAQGAALNVPLFATPHMYFPPTVRARTYGSFSEVQSDTDIPVGSVAETALKLGFSQTPSPSSIVLGRQEATEVIFAPSPVADSTTYSLSIIVTDLGDSTTVSSTSVVVSDADATAAEITASFVLDITTTNTISNVTATDGTGDFKLVPDVGFGIQIKALIKLADTYTVTEDAGTLLAAISAENNDWYFMLASDHTETFQLAMASSIEATGSSNSPKMYFTSTADVDSIVAVVEPVVDVIGKLQALDYDRTSIEWHDQADTILPEIGTVSHNSIFQGGTTTWKFMQVTGVPISADPVTGNNLTTGQQGFIEDRDGNWTGEERGVKFFREGVTSSSEFIDTIRGNDWLNDQIEVELLNLLLNQKGGKIPFTTTGNALATSVVNRVLTRAVESGFLSGYLPATLPDIQDIPFADKVARILKNMKWTGFLAGAIHTIIVDGNVTFEQ